jgi:hypothetical protein
VFHPLAIAHQRAAAFLRVQLHCVGSDCLPDRAWNRQHQVG